VTTELALQGDPNAVLDAAINAAKALSRVVSQKKKPVIMNGEQYLEFEDWQTLGQFYAVTVKTGDAVMVDIGGVKGARATAQLISLKTGEIIGGAEAYCMRDEDKWGTRPKYEYQDNERVKIGDEPVPWFQLASMAQTRAGAKALRNRLAWIAVLAGYRPTPAEEMTGTEVVQVDQAGHWCKIHNTAFFLRGKMKSFAHPIAGTKDWCHEPTEKKEATGEIKEEKTPETATPEPPKPPEPPQEATKSKPDVVRVKRDPSTIKNATELFKACNEDFKMTSSKEVLAALNIADKSQIDDPADCYARIAARK